MKEKVNVIIHSAVTVSFKEPLKVAMDQNVLGLAKMLKLAHQLPKLEVFVQVSTAT